MNQSNKKTLVLKVNNKIITIKQRSDMFCATLDTILLVNFVQLKNRYHSMIDFGTNNGIIAILLAKKFAINVIAIEIQRLAALLAQQNVIDNQLTSQVTIINDDIKNYAWLNQANPAKKVDAIVCNPPFFPFVNNTKIKNESLKVVAKHENQINLATIIDSAAKLLKNKGKLFMVYDAKRIDYLCNLLIKSNFAIKRLQIVYPKINKPANIFLIEAVYNAKLGVIIESPLICHNLDNTYHPEITKWYNNCNLIMKEESKCMPTD